MTDATHDRTRARALLLAPLALLASLTACAGDDASGRPSDTLLLATTTSTVDSGLLDLLVPVFEEEEGCTVKALGVGSGEALQLGSSGNADALLVHSPAAEEEFMADGDGASREAVMHNDFVVVGPPADPADVAGSTDAAKAMAAIARAGAPFASRADESGTHTKELELWDEAGVAPGGDWYLETGQSMGETLTIASQKDAYTLTDRGTYLVTQGVDLELFVERSDDLLNYYHVIVVDHAGVNTACGTAFSDWLVDPGTQRLIGDFGVEEYGQPLFVPDA